jgi:hypothetical protein
MRRRGVGRSGRPSLLGTAARTAVIAGTATAVSGRVAANQQAAAAQRASTVPPPPPLAPPPPVAPPRPVPPSAGAPPALTDEVVNELRTLAELRDAGILTEDEFAGRKSLLLGLA